MAALNAQRAANGLPARLSHVLLFDEGCALHNHYQRVNNKLTHDEIAGRRGWTDLGSGGDGHMMEVLARGGVDWRLWLKSRRGPWESAPAHLFALLDPELTSVGAAGNEGYVCMRGRRSDDTSDSPQFFSYPGNGTSIYATEIVHGELPYAPMEKVGIRQGTPTGPNILLYQRGCVSPSDDVLTVPLVSAKLFRSDGTPVKTRLVTGEKADVFGAVGGDLIPIKPLAPTRSYKVTVTWNCDAGDQTQEFRFKTNRDRAP